MYLRFKFSDDHNVPLLFFKCEYLSTIYPIIFAVKLGNLGRMQLLTKFSGHMPRPNSWTSKTYKFSTPPPSFHSFTIRYKTKYHTSKSRMHVTTLSARKKSPFGWLQNSGIHGARQSWRIPLTIWSTVVTIYNAWLNISAFLALTHKPMNALREKVQILLMLRSVTNGFHWSLKV